VQVRGDSIDRLSKIEIEIRRGSLLSTNTPMTWQITQEQVGLVHEKQLK
jgi:hypothetical protein